MKIVFKTPTPQTQLKLVALQNAVRTTLERKRKLGQYVVLWKDNQLVLQGDDVPRKEQENV